MLNTNSERDSMKMLMIMFVVSVSCAMHPDIEMGIRPSIRMNAMTENETMGMARQMVNEFFGSPDHSETREYMVRLIGRKLQDLKTNRGSSYRRLTTSLSKIDRDSPTHTPPLNEFMYEALDESFRERELESKEKIEQIKASRIKFTAAISAITGISTAILTAVVTILVSNNQSCNTI